VTKNPTGDRNKKQFFIRERNMKIALLQMKIEKTVEDNLSLSLKAMREAAANGAEMIIFPELQFSPYFPQFPNRDASQYLMSIEHEAILALMEESKELGVVSFLSIFIEQDGTAYDGSPVVESDGRLLGVSKKVHIVRLYPNYERDYFTPSDTGFEVYDTSQGKTGVVICFDRHYPESIRICTLKGAELIVVPVGLVKGEPLETFEWEMQVSAFQNGVFIAMCNRVGVEHKIDFSGQSVVVNPNGDIVAKADDQEQILYADIDFDEIDRSREGRPYLKLRRPEFCKLVL
jgi:predicted amidohydrolase